MSKYVIIGNSGAAIGAISGIRATDTQGDITLISAEPYHTYARPYLPYWLEGKLSEEKMRYRPENFYERNDVTAKLGSRATKINCDEKCVLLENGERISYEKLLVGTGSRPFVPPFTGLDTVKRKYTFQSYDDAKAVAADAKAGETALVVGAGLIGLKAAEALFAKGLNVTVVDLSDKILSSILDVDGAEIVRKHIIEKGVKILLSTSVTAFNGNCATLSSGETLDFDFAILAVGVRPNIELISEAGGEVGRAIRTDTCQKTSLPDVYAAGDCTESIDMTTGEPRILALLPNAFMQGEIAGKNMAGDKAKYEGAIAMNAIGFFGLQTITAGSYEGKEIVKHTEKGYRKFILNDKDQLIGFIFVGDVAGAGGYVSAIKERKPFAE